MNLQHLQCFLVIVEEDSLSRAAERLHLTQPAISKRLAGLEAELGQRLFDRDPRRVALTAAGQLLLPYARRILQEVEDARERLAGMSQSVSGTLRVVASHHIGLHRLPSILQTFTQDYPDVNLNLRFVESEQARNIMAQDDADIALVTLPDDSDAAFAQTEIWRDRMSFCCGRHHPLLTADALSLELLGQFRAVLPARTTETFRRVSDVFLKRGVRLDAMLPTNDLEAIKMMVQVGMGWSVLPDTMLDDSLCRLSLPDGHVERRLGALLPQRRTPSPAIQALLALALKTKNPAEAGFV